MQQQKKAIKLIDKITKAEYGIKIWKRKKII